MRTLIIYHPGTHRNTEKVAQSISAVLQADLKKVSEAESEARTRARARVISQYEFIGFGSGIYFSKHHASLLNLVDRLPPCDKKVFIFSTSGMGSSGRLHSALRKKLKEKGCNIIGEFSCKGFDTFGPFKLIGGINKNRPNEKDLENARNFAASLLAEPKNNIV